MTSVRMFLMNYSYDMLQKHLTETDIQKTFKNNKVLTQEATQTKIDIKMRFDLVNISDRNCPLRTL